METKIRKWLLTRREFIRTALLAGLVGYGAESKAASPIPAPGTPAASGVTFDVTLTKKTHRLPVQIEVGDVVLLKSGTSRQKSNWDSVLRCNNRPNRESATGFLDVIVDDGSRFRGIKLQSNVAYVVKTTSPFTYVADASTSDTPRKATYTIDTSKIH